jgi:hypothetical protein
MAYALNAADGLTVRTSGLIAVKPQQSNSTAGRGAKGSSEKVRA